MSACHLCCFGLYYVFGPLWFEVSLYVAGNKVNRLFTPTNGQIYCQRWAQQMHIFVFLTKM